MHTHLLIIQGACTANLASESCGKASVLRLGWSPVGSSTYVDKLEYGLAGLESRHAQRATPTAGGRLKLDCVRACTVQLPLDCALSPTP